MKKYKVELTERQLATLSSAAELVARLGIGQYRDAFNWLPIRSDISWSDYHADVDAIGDIISKYTSSDLGVSNPDTSSTSKIAWDLYQSFRRELAWDRAVDDGIIESRNSPRDWSKMMGVHYDAPMKTSEEPLAVVEKVEESVKEL
jgi:hypothetical protein